MTGSVLARPHSARFTNAWTDVCCGIFGWRRKGKFVEIPGLTGGKTASYLPLLNYSDLQGEAAARLADKANGVPYLIRTLSGEMRSFSHGDMVTMRLPLQDDVWMSSLRDVCRNQVRKAEKSELTFSSGSSRDLIDGFYTVYARSMHGYGMPVFPKRLLEKAIEARDIELEIFLAHFENSPAAGVVVIRDNDFAWVPWGASDRKFLKYCPNHLIYWRAIKRAKKDGLALFDFGRSAYGEATFDFKKKWGAAPVALDYLRPEKTDVYARYSLAQTLWKKAPGTLVDRIGPKLCRYLAEL